MAIPMISILGGRPPNPFRIGIQEIEFRERLLTSLWYDDLWAEICRQLGDDRAQLVGTPDTSRNPTARLNKQLAVVYTPPPLITGVPTELSEILGDWSGPVMASEYAKADGVPMASKLTEIQAQALLYALTCNEAGVVFVWADVAGRVVPHLATPANMRGLEDSRNPGQPVVFAWRRDRDGAATWEIWDLRGEPSYYLSDATADDDVAFFEEAPKHKVYEELSRKGAKYPWLDLSGNPVIPCSILHRAPHAGLWDRSSGAELSQATVSLAVYLTHWGHGLKDGCWVRPYVLGASLLNGKTPTQTIVPGATPLNSSPNDLASILEFSMDPGAKQAMIGTISPAFDPKTILDSILAWEQALWSQILSVDISSTGGDPLEQLKEVRETYIRTLYPACREHDSRCFQLAAIVARRFGGLRIGAFKSSSIYREEIKIPETMEEPEEPTNTETEEDAD